MEHIIKEIEDLQKKYQIFEDTTITKIADIDKYLTNEKLQKKSRELDSKNAELENLGDIELDIERIKNDIANENKTGEEEMLFETKNLNDDNKSVDLVTKSLATNEDGEMLVDSKICKTINDNIRQVSPLRQIASCESISTNSIEYLIEDEHMQSGWVAEQAVRSVTDNSKIKKHKINVHEIYAQPVATQKLLDDSEIDIENWLMSRLKEEFAAKENEAFVHGDGKNKPRGFLTYKDEIKHQITAETAAVSFDDIICLMAEMEDIYMGNARFLMNRRTYSELKQIKDASGHYLWQHSLTEKGEEALFGVPITICSEMPDIASNKVPIALADFKIAYKIIDRTDIRLMRDPFTQKPFVKFYTTKRVGGDVINKNAIKLLKVK